MRARRGTDFWPGELGKMVHQYKPGDIVTSTITGDDSFMGSVREVHPKLNKVSVAWGGGAVAQHDPDEIMLHPHMNDFLVNRMSQGEITKVARRVRSASQVNDIEEKANQ